MSNTTQYMIWNKMLIRIPLSIATDTVDTWVVIGNVRYFQLTTKAHSNTTHVPQTSIHTYIHTHKTHRHLHAIMHTCMHENTTTY